MATPEQVRKAWPQEIRVRILEKQGPDGAYTRAILVGGQVIFNPHPPSNCEGEWCCIHNPSPHHMVFWEMVFTEDDKRMYRRCQHGQLHPDPDDPRKIERPTNDCDGCREIKTPDTLEMDW